MRLINADAVEKVLEEKHFRRVLDSDRWVIADIKKSIMELPTIDAEPVRHGKWKNDCVGVLHCSECNAQAPWKYGRDFIDYRWESNYCPNCGARMDVE